MHPAFDATLPSKFPFLPETSSTFMSATSVILTICKPFEVGSTDFYVQVQMRKLTAHKTV